MQDADIYALSPQGEREIKGGKTVLTPRLIELLVRMDGALTLGQIRASMPDYPQDEFYFAVSVLLGRGFVRHKNDSFGDHLQFSPKKTFVEKAQAEGEAAAMSLGRAGYYVSIARARKAARLIGADERMTALVVDDEPALAKCVQSYLEFEGFSVRLAANRAEIVDQLRTPPVPDLVLLDVVLPDADGFDILLRMREHAVLKNVPVIMLTGKATRESVIKGLARGADGYVTKPFEPDALMEAVRSVLGLAADRTKPGPASWRVE
jgi:two-component system, OmpR family, response regulator